MPDFAGYRSAEQFAKIKPAKTAGSIKWNSTNRQFQKWNGSSWEILIDYYDINVTKLGGYTASHFLGATATATNSDKLDGYNSTQFLRSDVASTSTARRIIKTSTTATDSTQYTHGGLEVRTDDNTPPSIGFHRAGYSAVALYEEGSNLKTKTATGLTGTVWTSANDGIGSGLDANVLNGYALTSGITADTVVRRDSDANISASYFKSSCASQTTSAATSSDICFRNDNTSDSKLRFMEASAFKTYCENIGIGGSTKAWVNFNGTGTVAIRDSKNVSSITDNGTGSYTVNLSITMADTNYGFSTSASNYNSSGKIMTAIGTITTTSILTYTTMDDSSFVDVDTISVVIFN